MLVEDQPLEENLPNSEYLPSCIEQVANQMCRRMSDGTPNKFNHRHESVKLMETHAEHEPVSYHHKSFME